MLFILMRLQLRNLDSKNPLRLNFDMKSRRNFHSTHLPVILFSSSFAERTWSLTCKKVVKVEGKTQSLIKFATSITHAGDDISTDSSTTRTWPTNLPLKVTAVTFYPAGNGKHHRTSKFQLVERGTPVLRRGQTFFIAVAFGMDQNKRQYEPNLDEIRLHFTFGPQSSPMNGTQQVIKVDKLLHVDETRWAGRVKGNDKNAVTIEVKQFYMHRSPHVVPNLKVIGDVYKSLWIS